MLFRDALLQNNQLVEQYSELKLALLNEHGITREEYTKRKTAFILSVLCGARLSEEELMEIADLPIPEDDEEPGPVGHLEILADLGMNGMEISALCDDEELFPDEQLEAIAARLGFGDQFSELLDL